MAKKSITTRKEDAVSIVGDSTLVEEIEKSALETKSDVLVEMSDTVSTEAIVEEAKTKKDVEEISAKDEQEADSEDDMEDGEPKDKKKKAMAKCSLTEGDIEVIRALITEVLPKQVEAPVVETALETKSALDIATDGLYNSVSQAIGMQGATIEQRLEAINPALQNLGASITALVRDSMGVETPATVSNDQAVILEAITSMSNSVKELAQKVAIMEEKSQTPSANPVQSRIPAPRSIQPVVSQSQTSTPANLNSVANIVRRSVSSNLPLK